MAEKEPLVYTSRKRFFLEEKRIVALKVQEYYSEYQREVQVAKERVNFNEKRKKTYNSNADESLCCKGS